METGLRLNVAQFLQETLTDMRADVNYAYPEQRDVYDRALGRMFDADRAHAALCMVTSKIETLENFMSALSSKVPATAAAPATEPETDQKMTLTRKAFVVQYSREGARSVNYAGRIRFSEAEQFVSLERPGGDRHMLPSGIERATTWRTAELAQEWIGEYAGLHVREVTVTYTVAAL